MAPEQQHSTAHEAIASAIASLGRLDRLTRFTNLEDRELEQVVLRDVLQKTVDMAAVFMTRENLAKEIESIMSPKTDHQNRPNNADSVLVKEGSGTGSTATSSPATDASSQHRSVGKPPTSTATRSNNRREEQRSEHTIQSIDEPSSTRTPVPVITAKTPDENIRQSTNGTQVKEEETQEETASRDGAPGHVQTVPQFPTYVPPRPLLRPDRETHERDVQRLLGRATTAMRLGLDNDLPLGVRATTEEHVINGEGPRENGVAGQNQVEMGDNSEFEYHDTSPSVEGSTVFKEEDFKEEEQEDGEEDEKEEEDEEYEYPIIDTFNVQRAPRHRAQADTAAATVFRMPHVLPPRSTTTEGDRHRDHARIVAELAAATTVSLPRRQSIAHTQLINGSYGMDAPIPCSNCKKQGRRCRVYKPGFGGGKRCADCRNGGGSGGSGVCDILGMEAPVQL
ncbi:hypothetical protein P154DRAFT_155166 [Amniculicola lignicola CBS 123094]|uniref:Zn(2)-C6 fungal-type domain-containing protein n=1 Tax=Amniculicola lignicola CBS 123094 TaxID=1392246 RepID=A0A6A5WWB0_9PLEO|nr:hypothetical protein P154DRAFT_155166 [Amniculicola lignicola CBS 123094]